VSRVGSVAVAVADELAAELSKRALLAAVFPDDSPLERARRPIGELRAAVALSKHQADVLDDRIAGLVEAIIQEADPFCRMVAWDSLIDACNDTVAVFDGIAYSVRLARLQLTCARIIAEARHG
jgi:hypothetical protein